MFCSASDRSPAYGVMRAVTRAGKARMEARILQEQRSTRYNNKCVCWRTERNEGATLTVSESLYAHVNSQDVTVESMRLRDRAHPANPVGMAGLVFARFP
jgi:hypothetical protein